MFPQRRIPQKKPESDDCEIEIRTTKQGKKIKFKGRCSRDQLRMLAKENGLEIEEE